MIAKADLVDGRYYSGYCRNTYMAVWEANDNCFWHLRYKFGYRPESIQHISDCDEREDGFVPYALIEPLYQDPVL